MVTPLLLAFSIEYARDSEIETRLSWFLVVKFKFTR